MKTLSKKELKEWNYATFSDECALHYLTDSEKQELATMLEALTDAGMSVGELLYEQAMLVHYKEDGTLYVPSFKEALESLKK